METWPVVDTYLARGSGDNDSSFRTRRDEFTRSMYRSIGSNRHQEGEEQRFNKALSTELVENRLFNWQPTEMTGWSMALAMFSRTVKRSRKTHQNNLLFSHWLFLELKDNLNKSESPSHDVEKDVAPKQAIYLFHWLIARRYRVDYRREKGPERVGKSRGIVDDWL